MSARHLDPLKIAFVGGGVHSAVGYAHFNASRLDGHFSLVAGCFSRNADHNEVTAAKYGVAPENTYPNWQALLEQESGKLDAIVILTPTPTHAEIVRASLQHGYAVICEKALGMSSAECFAMEQVKQTQQGYLAVTFNYSGYPMVRELRSMIRSGRLGLLQQIHIEMPQEGYLRVGANPQNWRRSDYEIPTVSLDLGVHVHHLVDFITDGKKPLRVVGDQSSYGQFEGIIDNVYCMAEYQDNIRMVSWWGKTALGYRNGLRIRVYGSEGSAEWYQLEPETLRIADNKGASSAIDRGTDSTELAGDIRYNRFKAGHPSGFVEAFANLYVDLASDLRRFHSGKANPHEFVYGPLEAAQGMQFLEKVSESARQRQWLEV